MKVKVSIILPVYNKEKYITKCLESIINQSFIDWELICIDDCSEDNSLNIIKSFAKQDSRIKVICNEFNIGAAETRNKGIELSNGDYLVILDADDYYNEKMLEVYLDRCYRYDLDVLFYDYYTYDSNNGKIIKHNVLPSYIGYEHEDIGLIDKTKIYSYMFQISIAAPWSKIYKKKFIIDNALKFKSQRNSNDMFFGKMSLVMAERIGYCSLPQVYYRINANNQISSSKTDTAINAARACLSIWDELIKKGIVEKYLDSFCKYTVDAVIRHIMNSNDDSFQIQLTECKCYIGKIYASGLLHENYIKKQYDIFLNVESKEDIKNRLINEYALCIDEARLQTIKDYISKNKYKTVIWGYGKSGQEFHNAIKTKGIVVDYIVDKNKNIGIGKEDAEKYKNILVIITNSLLFDEIYNQSSDLIESGELLDAQGFFVYNVPLNKCLKKVSIIS